MDEAAFWDELEYRVCRELSGMPSRESRAWWCDGFIAEHFDAESGRMSGRVWMGRGPRHQEEWKFALHLSGGPREREQVDWPALVPAEDVTGWLVIDISRRMMTIDPSRAERLSS